jgi:hypothetical protein
LGLLDCLREVAAMNKIVLEHYPVEKLPEDLRVGLDAYRTVRVIIEEEANSKGLATPAETVAAIRKFRAENPERENLDESVARIRDLRNEWDDE